MSQWYVPALKQGSKEGAPQLMDLNALFDDHFGKTPGSSVARGASGWGLAPQSPVAFQFLTAQGTPAVVANDVAQWVVLNYNFIPSGAFICAKTAPTASTNLVYDIKCNRAGAGFLTIFAIPPIFLTPGSNSATLTSLPTLLPSFQTLLVSDILRLDCIFVGETIAGENVTVQLLGSPSY
jgi:hypothetical protein